MIKFDSEKSLEEFIFDSFNEDGVCLIDGEEYDDCIRQLNTFDYGVPDLVFTRSYDSSPGGHLQRNTYS